MKKLFTLFGGKALETEKAIKEGKTITWASSHVEGRLTLQASVED